MLTRFLVRVLRCMAPNLERQARHRRLVEHVVAQVDRAKAEALDALRIPLLSAPGEHQTHDRGAANTDIGAPNHPVPK